MSDTSTMLPSQEDLAILLAIYYAQDLVIRLALPAESPAGNGGP